MLGIASNFSDHLHVLSIKLYENTDLVVDHDGERVFDCSEYILPTRDLSLEAGQYRVLLCASGFNPGEKIVIGGILRFSFGVTLAEFKGFRE